MTGAITIESALAEALASAASAASMVGLSKERRHGDCLLSIATKQVSLGDKNRARITLRLFDLDADLPDFHLSTRSNLLLEADDLEGALRLASQITDNAERMMQIVAVIRTMAEIGQYAEARSLIVSETDLQYRFELLNAYIAGLSNSASIAASDLDWLDIEVASYRPLTTNTEIRLLSQMGRIDNALALARNAREPQERAHLLSAISSYLMPTGNIEAAKSALLEAEACLKQNGLYGHSERRMYGYSFKKLGAYREAFDLVLSLPVKDRHQEMAYLADDLVKSGRLDDALQALNHVPRHHPDYSGTAAYVIAACQRDGRPFSAKAYKNVFPRSIVIQAMMDTPVPPAENPVVAQAMLDVAVEVLGRPKRIFRWPGDLIEDVTEEGSYVELASAFARLGRLDTAISLIERIKSPFDLAYAHASFAAELVPQGRKSLAGEFADNAAAVGLKDYPISGYYGIVRILAEASLLDQALRLYRRLYVDPEDYPEHFRDISAMLAGRLTAGYQFPNALEIVERCQSPEDRTAVWLGIYEALYTAGASHLN